MSISMLPKNLSPLTKRRLQNFKANRRGYWSLWIFLLLLLLTLPAEFVSNENPLLVKYEGRYYFPNTCNVWRECVSNWGFMSLGSRPTNRWKSPCSIFCRPVYV